MMSINENPIPYIPESAPFSSSQRGWLNGYLAGLCSYSVPGIMHSGNQIDSTVIKSDKVYVLFGSQTGNAESAAKQFAKKIKIEFPDAGLMSLDEFDLLKQAEPVTLLILTSTYGEGDPPDNAVDFVSCLKSDDTLKCENIKFSIFGFGDSSYPDFNACARFIDEALDSRGGMRLCPAVYADVEYESELANWQSHVLSKISTSPESPGIADTSSSIQDADIEQNAPIGISKKNPFSARILENYNLNSRQSSKRTHHVSLSIDSSVLTYEAGDALGVLPANCPLEIGQILDLAKLNADESVSLINGQDMPLKQALIECLDVHTLRNECLSALEKLDPNGPWNDRFEPFAKLRLVEILELTGIIIPTGNYLACLLRPIQPRLYSISSSPQAHHGQVHVTVGVVNYQHQDFQRKGLCSNFLSGLEVGQEVDIYIHNNTQFKLPDDDRDIIMIGPGTGIAPFRGFLHHRMHSGSTGKNWLFFGDQRAEHDFLYQNEIDNFLKSGNLTRLNTAFSRDQDQKIYVQDRLKENARELVEWLERGANLYVCGDASRMARDVEKALVDIVSDILNKSTDWAAEYVSNLKKQGRYLRDVY